MPKFIREPPLEALEKYNHNMNDSEECLRSKKGEILIDTVIPPKSLPLPSISTTNKALQ
jgi:hypothetical protein